MNLNPNKNMAINGTDSTSLTVNGGTIKVTSSSSNVGGIYLRKQITFNNCEYSYQATSGKNHAIDSEGNVVIKKGTYNLISGSGKGIQVENNLYIGEESGSNSDLTININTSNEGIQAEIIEIYSGNITINSNEDGINAAGNDCDEEGTCRGNCKCYIKLTGGVIDINSGEDGIDSNGDITISGGSIIVYGAGSGADQPIDQDGILSITGGTVFAAGSSDMGGVSATNSQNSLTYKNTIASGKTITITDSNNNNVFSLTNKKEVEYVYFTSSGSGFSLSVDNNSNNNNNNNNSTNSTISRTVVNHSKNLKLSYILYILSSLLLLL